MGVSSVAEQNAAWRQDWQESFITDSDVLTEIRQKTALKQVRLTQTQSAKHPGATLVYEFTVVGHGAEVIYDVGGQITEGSTTVVHRLAIVADNGHAYHVKPGQVIELRTGEDAESGEPIFETLFDFTEPDET